MKSEDTGILAEIPSLLEAELAELLALSQSRAEGARRCASTSRASGGRHDPACNARSESV